jgi:hypothetical protein
MLITFPLINIGKKDPKIFVKSARQKGSKKNKVHVNSSKFYKHLLTGINQTRSLHVTESARTCGPSEMPEP